MHSEGRTTTRVSLPDTGLAILSFGKRRGSHVSVSVNDLSVCDKKTTAKSWAGSPLRCESYKAADESPNHGIENVSNWPVRTNRLLTPTELTNEKRTSTTDSASCNKSNVETVSKSTATQTDEAEELTGGKVHTDLSDELCKTCQQLLTARNRCLYFVT